ncbi:MAG: gamma carbonic anhydrase family protein, partial [Proteobacteria bacterium]
MKFSLAERRIQCHGEHFIAPNATLIGSVTLGHDTSVWFNTVIRADNDQIVIGDRSNVQDSSVLHTDAGVSLVVGNDVTVGHMVMLHGCTIGDGSLIGIKAVVMNH